MDTNTMMHLTTRPPSSPAAGALLQRKCGCGGSCGPCGEEKKKRLQRSPLGSGRGVAEAPPIVHDVLSTAGRPLDGKTRDFFEPRFSANFTRVAATHAPQKLAVGEAGDAHEAEADRFASGILHSPASAGRADLSGIRVHTDAHAAASARAVGARAYTVGPHIVFGAGEYAPHTSSGRELLAHELAHAGQQGSAATLRRRLIVGPLPPSLLPDPASSMTQAALDTMVTPLVNNLCDGFTVNSSHEVVPSSAATCTSPSTSGKPTGCCCLCLMSDRARPTWTIRISENTGAHTNPGTRDIIINPSTSDVESMHWTAGSASTARRVLRPRQITLGHELCGHASLLEIDSHPGLGGRATSDEHDPTIRIERAIWDEQGLPAADRRGLAASGVHRGESFSRITVSRFPFGSADVSRLDPTEQRKLSTAATFISRNDWFVDLVGHSDPVGSATAKQAISDQRAAAVQRTLVAAGVTTTTSHNLPAPANRFTSVTGASDSQPPGGSTSAPHEQWRRVEIFMANFPAGAAVPPAGTPTGVSSVGPSNPAQNTANRASADPCTNLLSNRAWTP